MFETMFHAHYHEDHEHPHHHHHDHSVQLKRINRAFTLGIVLNTAFVIAEAGVGFATGSLALLSDAGHNLSDVAGLLISVLAFKLAEVKPTEKFTYGFSKGTVLAGMTNAIILSVAVGGIGYSSVLRLMHPVAVEGFTISKIAFIGILINGFSAMLFMRQQQNDINIRGAYLHLLADALISAGVVIAGVAIHYTGWLWLDPAISLLVMLVLVFSTWRLLKSAVRLFLDGVPDNVDLEKIRTLKNLDERIVDIHHIHVWPIGTGNIALTAHVLMKDHMSSEISEEIKQRLKTALYGLHIHHATLEIEFKHCKSEENH